MAGKLVRNRACVWSARAVFAVCLAFGAWSFVDPGLWRYMTLAVQFAFVDPAVPLALRIAQFAAMGAAIAGVAHYVQATIRRVRS